MLPRSYIKCQPPPSRWPPPTAGPGADASPGLWGGSAREICCWRGRCSCPGPRPTTAASTCPFRRGHCWRARAGWCWPCRGCSAFWAGAAGRYSPPGSPWQTQRWMSVPSATPAFRCRSRFRAGRWCWCGSVPCKAACRPPWVLIWSSTSLGPLPCPTRRWGCALSPAPPWPGTVSCRPSRQLLWFAEPLLAPLPGELSSKARLRRTRPSTRECRPRNLRDRKVPNRPDLRQDRRA